MFGTMKMGCSLPATARDSAAFVHAFCCGYLVAQWDVHLSVARFMYHRWIIVIWVYPMPSACHDIAFFVISLSHVDCKGRCVVASIGDD